MILEMAPKDKRKKKKKSLHQSIQSVAQVFPGTSELSLPNLSSTFPALYSPGTPSYSLDLCRLMLETSPTSEVFDGYYVRNPIRNLIKNLMKVHGLSKDSQAVKDYKARQQGLHPSPDMSDHTEEIIRTSDLTLEQQFAALETVYQNYVAGAQYLEKKATETSRMLNDLDQERRRLHSDASGQLNLTPFKPDEETSEESTDHDDNKETHPNADAQRIEDITETVTPVPNPDTTREKTSEEILIESTIETVTPVDDLETITPVDDKPKVPVVRKKKMSKMINFWEFTTTNCVQNAVFNISPTDEKPEENIQAQESEDKSETLVGAVGGIPETEHSSGDANEKKPKNITIPFNPSQMQIPILQPNLLLTSDVGPSGLVMTTGQPTISSTIEESQASGQTISEDPASKTDDNTNEDDEYMGLRLPKPIKESDEKYPKDQQEEDSPMIMSPAALGGVSYELTSRSLEMPIGSPRNYEILEE